MFTNRFWGNAASVLCALLLQSCQLHSVRATEEEKLAVGSSSVSAMRQHAYSEPSAVRPLARYGASPAAYVPPSRFSTTPAHRQSLSGASSTLSTVSNSLVEPCDLPAAVMPRVSRAVPLGSSKPNHALLPVFMTYSGEQVRFIQIDGQWRAAMQVGYGVATLQHTLPVVGPTDVSNFLFWLQGQNQWTSREYIHILKVPQTPYGLCVYLGGVGVLGEGTTFSSRGSSQGSRTASRMVFGAKEWRHYYGEVGEEPVLPYDIEATLNASCSFWHGKKVRDTHLLVLIPATVDRAPFTLNLLKELIEHPKNGGYRTQYRYYSDNIRAQIGAASPQASYWLLMTCDVLPWSRRKTYSGHKKLVANHARRTSLPYEVPKALEAATAILTHHAQNGERLYGDNPWTGTRCQELMLHPSSRECPVVVGGFDSSGLDVVDVNFGIYDNGVAGCRKFCVETVSRTTPTKKKSLSTASSFRLLSSSTPSALTAIGNPSTAPCDPPAAAMPEAPRAASSGDGPGHVFSPDDLWRSSIGRLNELAEVFIAETFIDEEETSKQPAKRRSSDPEGDFSNKKVRYREELESDKAAELPAFWDPAAQHDQACDDAEASPDMFYAPKITAQKAVREKKQEQSKSDARLRQYKEKEQQLPSFLAPAEPFGASAWQQYFGEVGLAPDLPSDIDDILNRACPFWSGRKVGDTHLLVLIPAKVNGQPFSLNLLHELIQNPKVGGHRAQYCCYDSDVQLQLGAASPQASYWLLMTRDVLPKSRNKTYADQKRLFADHARRTSLPYELPRALEAATAILTRHVQNGERLYSDGPWTWTRCQEWILRESNKYPVVVGGFGSSGPDIYSSCCSRRCHDGVAGCRKFF
jgi:hypothetical protein